MLNEGATAAEIHALLFKVSRFKALLPAAPPKPEFAMPAPVNKRAQPAEQKNEEMNPSPPKLQKQSTISFKPKSAPEKFEEEKTAAACLAKHGGQIVGLSSFEPITCRMCGMENEGGYKCGVCSDSFYCNDCRKLDALEKIEDGNAESVVGDVDDTASISLSMIESQHMEEFLFEEGSQMRPDIAQFEQQKRSGSTSSSQILFGDKEGPKKRDVKADEKEQQRQEKMEHESIRSGDSKVSGTTIKSTTTNRSKSGAIIRELVESEWEELGRDKHRNLLFKCLACSKQNIAKSNRSTHACPKKV